MAGLVKWDSVMKRCKWDLKSKAGIVLEGLRGRSVGELLCSEHQYYQWWERFLGQAYWAFETERDGGELQRLKRKNANLERIRIIEGDHSFWGYRRVWAHLRYFCQPQAHLPIDEGVWFNG